jgi:hypothetical protein
MRIMELIYFQSRADDYARMYLAIACSTVTQRSVLCTRPNDESEATGGRAKLVFDDQPISCSAQSRVHETQLKFACHPRA